MEILRRVKERFQPERDSLIFYHEGVKMEFVQAAYSIHFTEESKAVYVPDEWVVGYLHFNPYDEEIPQSHPEKAFEVLQKGYRGLKKLIEEIESQNLPKPDLIIGSTSKSMGAIGKKLGMTDLTTRFKEYEKKINLGQLPREEVLSIANKMVLAGWLKILLPFLPPYNEVQKIPKHLSPHKIMVKSEDPVRDTYYAFQIMDWLDVDRVSRLLEKKITDEEFNEAMKELAHQLEIDHFLTDGVILHSTYEQLVTGLHKLEATSVRTRWSVR